MYIEINNSTDYNYIAEGNIIKLFGIINENESYIAKFITQCFQKLLIDENILIVPAACVSNNEKCILIIGDYWQGKTTSALAISKNENLKLVSDNYVAIKDQKVIGSTCYISIREEDGEKMTIPVYTANNRSFYKNYSKGNLAITISGFLLPYINDLNNNIHTISREESVWYLYQKLIRIFCGETILFDGKLASPVFIDKNISIRILNIVNNLLDNCKIEYVSSSILTISREGRNILLGKVKTNE